jgi:hypothetical protein
MKSIQNILVIVAILFGLLTIFAGTRVLLGSDPGYVVYRPLLIYNTLMGIVYVVAGVVAWRHIKKGMILAAVIFALNLFVLVSIYYLYSKGDAIAVDSLRAMTLRTSIWLMLLIGFGWLSYRRKL